MRMLISILFICALGSVAWADALPHRDAAAINSEVDAVFARIDTAQAQWKASQPPETRYIQFTAAPTKRDGGTATRPDLDTKTPSDRTVGMRDLGFLDSDRLRCDYIINEYFTPPRQRERYGYVIHAELEIAGEIWRRSRQFGPEDFGFVNSATDWYRLETPE